MAVAFQAAAPAVLSNRSMATAVIASTLGWSLDFFDLLILLYVAPAVGKAFFPLDFPDFVGCGGLCLVRGDAVHAAGRVGPVRELCGPARPQGSHDRGGDRRRGRDGGVRTAADTGPDRRCRAAPVPPASPASRRVRRRCRRFDAYHRDRIGAAAMARINVRIDQWRRRRPGRIFCFHRLLRHFVDFHGGCFRRLGLALHVLRRYPELRIRRVDLRRPRKIADLERARSHAIKLAGAAPDAFFSPSCGRARHQRHDHRRQRRQLLSNFRFHADLPQAGQRGSRIRPLRSF